MIKQDPNTDVELALIDKCRLLKILLNDESCCLNSILGLTSALSLFWEVTCHIWRFNLGCLTLFWLQDRAKLVLGIQPLDLINDCFSFTFRHLFLGLIKLIYFKNPSFLIHLDSFNLSFLLVHIKDWPNCLIKNLVNLEIRSYLVIVYHIDDLNLRVDTRSIILLHFNLCLITFNLFLNISWFCNRSFRPCIEVLRL